MLEPLLRKELNLSTLSLVSGILSEENKKEVIAAVCGKSRRAVEEYVSRFHPRREIRERIKPVVVTKKQSVDNSCASLFEQKADKDAVNHCAFAGEGSAKASRAHPVQGESAKENRFELRFSISSSLMDKLNEAKCVLSGKYPGGVQLEAVFEEALEVLLEKRSPKRREKRRAKRSKQTKTSAAKPVKQTRHIPEQIRDRVYLRDGGCCSYVSESGVRCNETRDLEVHHAKPFGRCGGHEMANLQLMCRKHNLLQAKCDYGKENVEACIGLMQAKRRISNSAIPES